MLLGSGRHAESVMPSATVMERTICISSREYIYHESEKEAQFILFNGWTALKPEKKIYRTFNTESWEAENIQKLSADMATAESASRCTL